MRAWADPKMASKERHLSLDWVETAWRRALQACSWRWRSQMIRHLQGSGRRA
jgi:hypothetical protein